MTLNEEKSDHILSKRDILHPDPKKIQPPVDHPTDTRVDQNNHQHPKDPNQPTVIMINNMMPLEKQESAVRKSISCCNSCKNFGATLYGILRFFFTILQNVYHIPTYLFFMWVLFIPCLIIKPSFYKKIENFLYNCCLYTVSSWSWLANIQVIECGDDLYRLPERPVSVNILNNGNNNRLQESPERRSVTPAPSPSPSLDHNNHHSSPNHHHNSDSHSLKNNHHHNSQQNMTSDDHKKKSSEEMLRNNSKNSISSSIKSSSGGGSSSSPNKNRVLMIANHQSTGDVPLMFQAFSSKCHYVLLWVMDYAFKYTNFGVVSATHGDYFIQPKSFVKSELTKHCLNAPEKNLIILFPEGGFRYKRIESSDSYAKRMGWPSLKHLTWPRAGAFLDLMDTRLGVTHIVDLTILYKDQVETVSIVDIAMGRRPQAVYFHYRVFEVSPQNISSYDENWLNQKWMEKEQLMKNFYDNPEEFLRTKAATLRPVELNYLKLVAIQIFYFTSCYIYYLTITLIIYALI